MDTKALEHALRCARRAAPRETGGLLLGYSLDDTIHVVDIAEVPDQTATRTSYVRPQALGQDSLDEALKNEPDARVGYMGDWHSHPAAVGPSSQDIRQLRSFARETGRPIALMVVYPMDSDQPIRVRVSRGGLRTKEAVVEVGSSEERQIPMRGLFEALQGQLDSVLSASGPISHPTDKGDISESGWRSMLERFLPARYAVRRATVIDSTGGFSDNIDVVIHDRQYSPLLFQTEGVTYVPAESVYAAFEVKPTLDRKNILYAAGKAESVRRLQRTSISITHLQGQDTKEQDFVPLAGILTLDSDWNPAFGDPMNEALGELNEQQRIDLGCALRQGGFRVKYEPQVEIEGSEASMSLAFFFSALVARLQQLGTVPALDIEAYIRAGGLPETR